MQPPLTLPEQADDRLEVPEDCELVDGEPVVIQRWLESNFVSGVLLSELFAFCRAGHLGYVFPPGTTYRCFPDRNTARKPDVSVILRDRIPAQQLTTDECPIRPDLAALVVSPNTTVYELDRMVEDYLSVGVRLVWVINPKSRRALVHRPDGSVTRVSDEQALDGADVLPGFRCPLADILLPWLGGQGNGS